MTKSYFTFSLLVLCFVSGFSQERIAVAQSSTDIVVLLNPTDGSIVDSNFIDLTALSAGTPKDICQVNDELWITDQIRDRIDRFDLSGNYLSTIESTVGLDNIRGISLVNGEVWVCNFGSNNGAPGSSIIRFSTDGTLLGNFPISGSPFDVIDTGTEAIISNSTSDEINRYDYSGNPLSTITNTVDFPQQIQYKSSTNSLFVAGFSPPDGAYEFDVATGSQLYFLDVGTSLRGIIELDNGDLLVSGSSGIFTINTGTNSVTTIASGSSQYLERIDLSPLSVEEQTLSSFKIYPNPSDHYLNISSNSVFDEVIITDLLGQTVNIIESNSDFKTIDTSDFSAGLYIITIRNGERTFVRKFIKK